MALFQPTNIHPSSRGPLGNGTVDITQDLTVSFQVNGNSAMTAYEATIYTNDQASSQVYTTGKLTEGCPFYGTNYAGETVPFSFVVEKGKLTGLSNGKSYKLVLTLYWSDTDKVVQTSAAAFVTRSAPTVTLGKIPETLGSKKGVFTATYTQAQGDGLNWVRWQIAYDEDREHPFYDTHNIYGTAQLEVRYDGFFRKNRYAVRCLIQTANGVEADSGWQGFAVDYSAYPLIGAVAAQQEKGDRSAVLVQWPKVAYIPGKPTGPWEIIEGELVLGPGGSVEWDQVNGEPMAFAPPWSVLYKGIPTAGDVTLFALETSEGRVALLYGAESSTLTLALGPARMTAATGVWQGDTITAILTPTRLYLRLDHWSGGLLPSPTLYPGEALYPRANTILTTTKTEQKITYTQGTVTKIGLYGAQTCDWISLAEGEAKAQTVEQALNGTWEAKHDGESLFTANFENGSLNGGNLGQADEKLTGLAVYRQEGLTGTLEHLADVPLKVKQLYDYGAGSQQGPYTYYLFPYGEETYLAEPINSNRFVPCFWNWTILSCRERPDGTWMVEEEFTFGKNLASGTVVNGNAPGVLPNFTRFPTVQTDPSNYMGGTLGSLIGHIDGKTGTYWDSLALRDAIYGLSTTTNKLFLKNRKGDVMEIRVSGAIGMETWDGSRAQAQTVSLPWVQVGTAEGLSITLTPEDHSWATAGGVGEIAPWRGAQCIPQAKEVTPSKEEQVVVPDEDYNALSRVTVLPIPENFGEILHVGDALTIF